MPAALVDLSWDRPAGPVPEGDAIRAYATLRNYALGYVDPTTVAFRVRAPDLEVATYIYIGAGGDVTRISAGRYYLDIPLDDPGTYVVRAECSGTWQGAAERHQAVAAELV